MHQSYPSTRNPTYRQKDHIALWNKDKRKAPVTTPGQKFKYPMLPMSNKAFPNFIPSIVRRQQDHVSTRLYSSQDVPPSSSSARQQRVRLMRKARVARSSDFDGGSPLATK
jgi:hypothetical protein